MPTNLKKVLVATQQKKQVVQVAVDKCTATNIGFAARLAGHWSNGHFIAINFIWAGQTLLGFCLLTCTFISLFSSGSGLDEQ
jgi:hypothetical protein